MKPSHGNPGLVRRLLAGLALAACVSAQRPATDPDAPPPPSAAEVELEALLARLTAPLQQELVQAAVRQPLVVGDGGAAQSLVAHLKARGGAVALAGLLVLATHQSPEVRIAALGGIASLGMRGAGAAECARDALRDLTPEVRLAAIAALGAVGEAGDVTDLIELLQDEDKDTQVTAHRALCALTGLRLASDARLWSYWWKQTAKDLPPRLEKAVKLLTDGGDEADVLDARRLLAQSAWFDLPKAEDAAREWLAVDDQRQRSEGLRLVTAARLAALVDDVARALRGEAEPELLALGAECELALGTRSAPPPETAPAAPPETPR